MMGNGEVLVADECWIALALLHRNYPERISFSAREILDSLKLEKAHPEVRPGVQPHIYMHNVANVQPNSARYRMFYRLSDGTLRLFRPGDDFHPARKGKTIPERSKVPARYHELLEWYEKEYCRRVSQSDPVLQMRGVGKEIWMDEGADAFVARERKGWDDNGGQAHTLPVKAVADRVWNRIITYQDQEFHTLRGKPFTYVVEAKTGIRPYCDGKRVNRRLGRRDIERAVSRCPLDRPKDIKDCRGSSYLFGLLMDGRIRDSDW